MHLKDTRMCALARGRARANEEHLKRYCESPRARAFEEEPHRNTITTHYICKSFGGERYYAKLIT